MFGNHVLRLRLRFAVKLNFQPYIRRYTSPNENFEYSYPLIIFFLLGISNEDGQQDGILSIYLVLNDTNTYFLWIRKNSLVNHFLILRLLQTEQTQISCMIRVYFVCLWKYDISDPTLVDMTTNFSVLCSNMKVYLYNYS